MTMTYVTQNGIKQSQSPYIELQRRGCRTRTNSKQTV